MRLTQHISENKTPFTREQLRQHARQHNVKRGQNTDDTIKNLTAAGLLVPVNGTLTLILPTQHVVKNLMSGKDVIQDKNTPLCCDVSRETYWSM